MTFAPNRPPGGFTPGSTISQAELENWDANLANALDGANGGAYSLSADLVLGGSDLVLLESLEVGGVLDLAGDLTVGDDIDVVGRLDVGADASIGGLLTVTDLSVLDDANIDGTLDVDGSASIAGDLAIGDDLSIVGDLTVDGSFLGDVNFTGDVYFDGTAFLCQSQAVFFDTVTLRDVVSFASSGKLAYRSVLNASNADHTVLAAQVDTYYNPNGVLSTNRNVTIDDTGASNGMRVRFWNNDVTHLLTVKGPGATTLALIGGAGSSYSCEVERIAGTWQLIGE